MIEIFKTAANEAGTVLLKYYKKNLALNYKTSHKDIYTIADIESQRIIKETITKLLLKKGIKGSEIGFIGEENLNVTTNKERLFVIDPLDGTTNYVAGFDLFSVSIAYFYKGILTAGLVYQPTTKDYYFAQKNQGAFKNNQPLKIAYKPLKRSILEGLISSRPEVYPRLFKIYQNIFPHVAAHRNINSMAISNCFLANNVFNIVSNGHTFIWDIAAAKLIVEEAGGVMFDFKGQSVHFDFHNPKQPYNVISCHPKLKAEILPFFSQ